ncbi:MAG: membrane integrity-associated transporter subunit PqiC [Caulobacterales bacterium]|nr:membrane integrity-associated transporter subunit PqiC [Caulobacterales bacterium]
MSRRLTAAVLTLTAIALTGCISLFPKAEPARLYRFEARLTAQAFPPGDLFGVLRLQSGFPRASAGDRILTVNAQGEAAYIAGARWVSPASVLFDEQVSTAFQNGGRARLISRGEVIRAVYSLKLDVQSFETVYDQGPKAAPVVVVAVRGVITRNRDRALAGEQTFTARIRAADNRVSAIVPAYNQALSEVLGQLVGWVNAVDTTDK